MDNTTGPQRPEKLIHTFGLSNFFVMKGNLLFYHPVTHCTPYRKLPAEMEDSRHIHERVSYLCGVGARSMCSFIAINKVYSQHGLMKWRLLGFNLITLMLFNFTFNLLEILKSTIFSNLMLFGIAG